MDKLTEEMRQELYGKRLLILGGSLWKDAIKQIADYFHIHLIATGNDQTAGIFEIAEEAYSVNSTNYEEMKELITSQKIDGVYMGGSESVISAASQYLKDLNMPCYCTPSQWSSLQNKEKLKHLLKKYGLPVVKEYSEDNGKFNVPENDYPVVTKPVDGCGSDGFYVCQNKEELNINYLKAKNCSQTQKLIVEQFVKNDGVVVFYTISNGKIIFSGLEEKYPVKYPNIDRYVGGLFVFESPLVDEFRNRFEFSIGRMIEDLGIQSGSFWIEVFHDQDNYYFNEAGFRYGGSASIYPINYMHDINQVAADIYYALTGRSVIFGFPSIIKKDKVVKKYYGIYPLYLKGGIISEIKGLDRLKGHEQVIAVPVRLVLGSEVKEDATFSQVFSLVHFVFDTEEECKDFIKFIHNTISVLDENYNEMIVKMLNLSEFVLR